MYGDPFDTIGNRPIIPYFFNRRAEKPKAVIFCDAENVVILGEPGVAKSLDSWLEMKFDDTTRFAFADWTRYSDVGDALYIIKFDLIHVPDSLRDSTDCVMGSYIVDWLMRNSQTDAYVIISGDSIFAPIMQALQKQGKTVVLVSNPEDTRPETIIRADQYEDIGQFTPFDFSRLTQLERDEDILKQYTLRRLLETIAKIREDNKPTFPRYVEVMAKRWHPDVKFGRPGFYSWDEALITAIFDGLLGYDGEGIARQLVPTDQANSMIESLGDLESAINRFVTNLGKMYEEGQDTSISAIESKIDLWNIDLEKLGYEDSLDFIQVIEGRKLLRIEKSEDQIDLQPVYSEDRVEEWYREIAPSYFGSTANIPSSKYIRKTISFLYNNKLSLSKVERYLRSRKSKQMLKAILEASDVSFIPPYEQVVLYSLLGLGKDVSNVVDILNKEMKTRGITLVYPEEESS
jgi:hypothetical protein